ncbi:hypothetical protein GCM10010168_59580 [Actinoplanes ianthinogenes]|uniref:Uncharacterized protein n=2 Tax=Actinoplanes ianthinogenes TaxID=122358 RepID=A0ABN6CP21_9ACTN|nr:hypothetical protein Aiant_69760 [Actinoplanes ianthinogenes]GGR33477.1 hypothetical protein GCM10010168_59580 [Actinoplanes ianthinogenes]
MARAMTPGGLVTAALRDNLFPAGARSWGRGWLAWTMADLEYRAVVDRDGESPRWRVFVGDARLGPAFEDYGRLSIPLDHVGVRLDWPEGSRLGADQAVAVQALCRDVMSFAGSRRQLALLMMSPEDVRRGDVVAWLPAGGWPGRLAQALVIATDLNDQPLASTIRGLITSKGTRVVSRRPRHRPDVTQAERDRLDSLYLDHGDLEQDVHREARHWLAQYCEILGRTIDPSLPQPRDPGESIRG